MSYEFPVTIEVSRVRKRFVHQWLNRYTWLVYSKHLDGAFCLPCVLFGRQTGHNGAKLDKLFKSPLTYWTSACSKSKDHEQKSLMHHDSMLLLQQFKLVMERKCPSVDQLADSALRARIKKNREILVPIVDGIIYCGRQNVALRGHRDDSKNYDDDGNSGNFQELLKFGIRRRDKVLADHFRNAPKNATYRSKTVQNEIIDCYYDHIIDVISAEIKEAKFFSVLARHKIQVTKNKWSLSFDLLTKIVRYEKSSSISSPVKLEPLVLPFRTKCWTIFVSSVLI